MTETRNISKMFNQEKESILWEVENLFQSDEVMNSIRIPICDHSKRKNNKVTIDESYFRQAV